MIFSADKEEDFIRQFVVDVVESVGRMRVVSSLFGRGYEHDHSKLKEWPDAASILY
jgi:hypothetical protein